jgi:hypothetical protein
MDSRTDVMGVHSVHYFLALVRVVASFPGTTVKHRGTV